MDDGLIAHYTFDDPADLGRDVSGQDYNGSVEGVQPIVGRVGSGAAFFDGQSKIVANSLQSRNWGQQLSVCFWFQRIDALVDYAGMVNAGYASSGSWEVRLEPDFMGGKAIAGVSSLANPASLDCPSVPIAASVWYHAALIFDGRQLRFLINGKLQVCASRDLGGILAMGKSVILGQAGMDSPRPQYFRGMLDDVRIYARALGESEVRDLMTLAGELAPEGEPAAPTTPEPAPAATEVIAPPVGVEPAPAVPTTPSPAAAPALPAVSADENCCDTLNRLVVDWLSGNREGAIRELDRLSRNYKP